MDSGKQLRRMVHYLQLNQESWTHYLYRCEFEGESYYSGVSKRKSDDPSSDGYFGSPVTNKEKWEVETPSKHVLALLWCENDREAYQLELNHQSQCYDLNDPKCLNEHFGGGFSTETCRKAGKIGSQVQVDNKIGIHGLTTAERSEIQKRRWEQLSEEEKERRVLPLRNSWNNLSEQEKERAREKLSVATVSHYNSLSDEEKEEKVKPMVEAAKVANTRTWTLLSPSGELVVVKNLAKFCRENGLQNSNMSHVLNGKKSHHKGWKVLDKH